MFDSNGVLNNNHFDLTKNHQLIDTGLVFLMLAKNVAS
jgi:hypothetical protein